MESRFVEGQRVTWVGLIFNIFLAIGKGFAGFLGFSQALVADALESISDIIATIFVLVSMRISGKPRDPEHPYGHFKIEQLTAAFIGFIIILGGVAIIILAVITIIEGKKHVPTLFALFTAIGVIIIKEGLYLYTIKIGRKIDSIAIIASAWDHRKDAITTVATLIGIVGARLGLLILDPIAAIVVAIFIFRIGYLLSYKAANELLDISPPKEIMDKITKIALSVKGIEHVTDVKARKTGPYLIVDIKLEIDSQMRVADSHYTAGMVKREIMRMLPDISDVMTHVNPHIAHD